MSQSIAQPTVESPTQLEDGHLADILHSSHRIIEYLAGSTLQGFCEDVQLQDSVLKRLLDISKRAQHTPSEICETMPDIPWENMRSLQTQLVQDEEATDAELMWTLIQNEIPPLVQTIQTYLPPDPDVEAAAQADLLEAEAAKVEATKATASNTEDTHTEDTHTEESEAAGPTDTSSPSH